MADQTGEQMLKEAADQWIVSNLETYGPGDFGEMTATGAAEQARKMADLLTSYAGIMGTVAKHSPRPRSAPRAGGGSPRPKW